MDMPKNRHLYLTVRAKSDLDEIMNYGVSQFGYEKAVSFIEHILDVVDLLCEPHYKIGNMRQEIKPNLLSFSVKNYVIFFYRSDEEIRIVRILHHSRDIHPSVFLS